MRNRAVTDQQKLEEIIRRAPFCHLAMTDTDNLPYVIPMNFGYHDGIFYFHGKRDGKKIRILKERPEVCIALSTDQELRWQNENVACSFSMRYKSVLAFGKAEFIEDPEEKRFSLSILMKQFRVGEYKFNPPSIHEVCCWKIKAIRLEGRIFGY